MYQELLRTCTANVLGPVVRKVDDAIDRRNHYPVIHYPLFVLLTLIHWIVIQPVDSVIQLLNNRGQPIKLFVQRRCRCRCRCRCRRSFLKDVRTQCHCASLVRTLFIRNARATSFSGVRTKSKSQQNIELMTFALTWCANIFVRCSVTLA